jgi:N-acetylneuraminic acid mutarotase
VQVLLHLVAYFFALTGTWFQMEPLPKPVTNNAIAGYRAGDNRVYFSIMGMGPSKSYKDVTRDAYVYTSKDRKWNPLPPVPGTRGRVAAQAYSSITGVLVLGGTAYDADGKETTVPDVDVFVYGEKDPTKGYWSRGVNMPTPVSDAVIGSLDEFHVYLISGWSNTDAVNDVQIYDPRRDRWEQATPIPGRPVFGHSGAIVDNYIVYIGGAYKNPDLKGPKFIASDEAWLGKIDRWKQKKIEWTKLPPFPSKARFRIAAGAAKHRVIFVGGAEAPYDYNGIGYDGKPVEPISTAFAYNVKTKQWETLPNDPHPTMDHHRLINDGYGVVKLGGMSTGQHITNWAAHLDLEGK